MTLVTESMERMSIRTKILRVDGSTVHRRIRGLPITTIICNWLRCLEREMDSSGPQALPLFYTIQNTQMSQDRRFFGNKQFITAE